MNTSKQFIDSEKALDEPGIDYGILQSALLDFIRATRRAKLAEVAALERLERSLLTIQGASRNSEA